MKKVGLICTVALAGISLAACGNQSSKKASSSSKASSSKVVKHHKKHVKNKKTSSSSLAKRVQQQNVHQVQQSNVHTQSTQKNQQQQTQPSNAKDQDVENLHIIYSDNANNGNGGLVSVYNHGDDQQTNQDAEQYGESIAQNGGSGDYHYN